MMRSFRTFQLTILLLAAAGAALGQGAATAAGAAVINDADRVTLSGNVPPFARLQVEIGRTAPTLPMQRMVLVLQPQAGAQDRLEQLLADLTDPAATRYHQWLTPEQFGAEFGLNDRDLKVVTDWLVQHGFTIDEVAKGRGWINFSGTAAQVEQAFATEMHDYQVDGVVRHANSIDPSLPRALTELVTGVVSLNNKPLQMHHAAVQLSPDFTAGSAHYMVPGDFATIYDLSPTFKSGINGTGETIAIVARTDIKTSDVEGFRSAFWLPVSNLPVLVHNGTDPGDLGGDEELEADLDAEWSGAAAPGATIDVVVSASTQSTDGIILSAQYIVDNNLAPVMSTSFGSCEADQGAAGLAFINSMWSQAAAQGISSFVSSGDSGASGCDVQTSARGTGLAVNGLCSTPYDICVGGTEFNEGRKGSAFWSPVNRPDGGSVIAYIPEEGWNESANVRGDSGLWSSGGGASKVYPKPSWQSARGVPNDHHRDVPDVSLSAAFHDAYVVLRGTDVYAVFGTSASTPSFAGLMALIVQKTGDRQGNANPVLYQLAAQQYKSARSPRIFHDITSGNNSVPKLRGFSCGPGYDQVTGLGSVDGGLLLANWP